MKKYAHPVWLVLLTCWPPAVFAASQSFGTAVSNIGVPTLLGWFGLSTLSGVTALFYKIDKELKKSGAKLPNPGVFISSQMFGSWTAGLLALLLGEGAGIPGIATAGSIIVFAFGGAVWLDKYVAARFKITLDNEQKATQ